MFSVIQDVTVAYCWLSRRVRIFETFSMVVDCLAPGSLTPGARGWESVLQVRLLHAHVRSRVQSRAGWSNAEAGVPINQQDLCSTCLSFSMVVLLGLERIGIALTAQEYDDYLHLW